MTSNVGSPQLMDGVAADGSIPEGVRRAVLAQLRTVCRPEFLNRVDETVLFSPLSAPELAKITELQFARLQTRLEDRNIRLEATPDAIRHIAESGYDPVYGARPIKRYLQKHVETTLGRRLIAGDVPDGSTVRMVLRAGEIDFEIEPPATPSASDAESEVGRGAPLAV